MKYLKVISVFELLSIALSFLAQHYTPQADYLICLGSGHLMSSVVLLIYLACKGVKRLFV